MTMLEHQHGAAEAPETTPWLRVVIAGASAAAGVVHLGMVPAHAGDSLLEATESSPLVVCTRNSRC